MRCIIDFFLHFLGQSLKRSDRILAITLDFGVNAGIVRDNLVVIFHLIDHLSVDRRQRCF